VLFGLIVEALNDHICGLEPALLRALDDGALSSPQSSGSVSRQAAEVAPRGVDSAPRGSVFDPDAARAPRPRWCLSGEDSVAVWRAAPPP
jgi:hypothetical protein